jgi:hypothetical protein
MKKKIVKVNLDEELLNDIRLISILEGCSVSFIIRTVINDYIKYYMYKNDKNNKNG